MTPETVTKVTIERRAEIALRSLDRAERSRVESALVMLGRTKPSQWMESGKIKALRPDLPNRLYSLRVSRLGVILSAANQSQWVVEDIVDHDRLPGKVFAGKAS